MGTTDRGETWDVFSRRLNCTNVYDVDVNPTTETAYVATHHRGVLEGDLSPLDDATDLRVDVACEEETVSESGTLNCTVDFGSLLYVDSPLMNDKLLNLECRMNSVTMEPQDTEGHPNARSAFAGEGGSLSIHLLSQSEA